MPTAARHTRVPVGAARSLDDDPAWYDVAEEVGYASELVFRHRAYGVSRESAGWVAEEHLRRAQRRVQQITERYAAGAWTRLGRAWRRRKTRSYLDALGTAIWHAEQMQGHGEVLFPPALFYRDGGLTLIDQRTPRVDLRVPQFAY